MKKKYLIGMMTVVSAVMLTSCAAQVPELSKLDNDKAAEYMAGEMLKYDTEYAYALDYDRSILNVTPTPVPTRTPVATPKPKADSAKADSANPDSANPGGSADGGDLEKEVPAVQEVSGAEIFDIPGIEIQYVSASVKPSYGKKYESIVASKGKELLILKFQIKNAGQNAQEVDLFDKELEYTLIQGDRSVSSKRTSAEGDLQYLKTKISPGKSKQGVLMFEVDKGTKIESNSLLITNGMKQMTVTLP